MFNTNNGGQAQVAVRLALAVKCNLPVFSSESLQFTIFISNDMDTTKRLGVTYAENQICPQK